MITRLVSKRVFQPTVPSAMIIITIIVGFVRMGFTPIILGCVMLVLLRTVKHAPAVHARNVWLVSISFRMGQLAYLMIVVDNLFLMVFRVHVPLELTLQTTPVTIVLKIVADATLTDASVVRVGFTCQTKPAYPASPTATSATIQPYACCVRISFSSKKIQENAFKSASTEPTSFPTSK